MLNQNHTMKLQAYQVLCFALFLFTSIVFAQEEEVSIPVTQALKEYPMGKQFDYVYKKSGRYQEYRVIKIDWYNILKKNAIDTLNTLEGKLATNLEQINKQQTTINELEASLAQTNQNLTKVSEEKDSLNFLGIAMTKSGYKSMMWGIAGVLLALLGFFVYKFKNSNTVTVQARKALAETEAEFEDHRRRALEREQKINRRLQDEINKHRKAGTS